MYIPEFAAGLRYLFSDFLTMTISRGTGMQYKQYHIPFTDHPVHNTMQYSTLQFTKPNNAFAIHKAIQCNTIHLNNLYTIQCNTNNIHWSSNSSAQYYTMHFAIHNTQCIICIYDTVTTLCFNFHTIALLLLYSLIAYWCCYKNWVHEIYNCTNCSHCTHCIHCTAPLNSSEGWPSHPFPYYCALP